MGSNISQPEHPPHLPFRRIPAIEGLLPSQTADDKRVTPSNRKPVKTFKILIRKSVEETEIKPSRRSSGFSGKQVSRMTDSRLAGSDVHHTLQPTEVVPGVDLAG